MKKIICESCKYRNECELIPYDTECDEKFEKIEKNFEKPIDKSIKVWYNINVIKGSHPHNKSGRKER